VVHRDTLFEKRDRVMDALDLAEAITRVLTVRGKQMQWLRVKKCIALKLLAAAAFASMAVTMHAAAFDLKDTDGQHDDPGPQVIAVELHLVAQTKHDEQHAQQYEARSGSPSGIFKGSV
jgi:hypothetical protein